MNGAVRRIAVLGFIGVEGCATHAYFPALSPARETEGMALVAHALADTLRDFEAPADASRTDVYVRIGERAAPEAFLRAISVPPGVRLRPDPAAPPRAGRCLQIGVGPADRANVMKVSVVWGHDHPPFVYLDHSGCNLTYERRQSDWALVDRDCWIE